MLEKGYAAVTSRRVAAKAGVKQPLVYYYFRTMDELFLAVFRRMAEQNLARLEAALQSEEPLRALWELSSDRSRTALTIEFLALSNHRKVVRAEIAAAAEHIRRLETEALARLFRERGIDPQIPPLVVSVLQTSLARNLVQESALGIAEGHAPTLAFVEACQRAFEEMGAALGPVMTMIAAQQPKAPSKAASKAPTKREARRTPRVARRAAG